MKNVLNVIILALALAGCSNEQLELKLPVAQNVPDYADAEVDKSTVTKADIQNVVSIFGNGSAENMSRSKAAEDYALSTIFDAEGKPAIYVINYVNDGGFVLVSATKDYHPILAYSDTGNYDMFRLTPSGVDLWEKSTVKAVQDASNSDEETILSHNIEWMKYSAVEQASVLRGPSNHEYISDEEYDELNQIYLRSVNELTAEGKTVYPYEASVWLDVLKAQSLYSAENIAKNVYWMYEDVWQDFATLVYWEEYSETVTSETVKSKWSQEEAFSVAYKSLPDGSQPAAGCGPIAAGQIMRYFQYPRKYNWQDMPLLYATNTTSKFLFDIAEAANAVYGEETSTQIANIRKVFLEFGFNADKVKTASAADIFVSLKSGSPVYMRGSDGNSTDYGHAWVATRAKENSRTINYDIYNFGGLKSYKEVGSAKHSSSTSYYIYYNWGWGGYLDGYFLAGDHIYNANMQVILNIKPK